MCADGAVDVGDGAARRGRRRGGGCPRPAPRSAPPSRTAGCAGPGPASVSARSTSYTAWWDTAGSSRAHGADDRVSVSACGCACTAASTASRGRVTRSVGPAQHALEVRARGHPPSLLHLLEWIKKSGRYAVSAPGLGGAGRVAGSGSGDRRVVAARRFPQQRDDMDASDRLVMPARVPSPATTREPSRPAARWLLEHRVQPVGRSRRRSTPRRRRGGR